MGYNFNIKNYYTVKKDGKYPWPCELDKNRMLDLYTDDILTKNPNGTFVKHTGLCMTNIILQESEVEMHEETVHLQLI